MISVLGFLTNSLELKNLDWPGCWAGLECRGAETLRPPADSHDFFSSRLRNLSDLRAQLLLKLRNVTSIWI